MKTIFFLQSSHCQSNRAELAGAIRASKSFGWNIRVIEYASAAADRRQHSTGLENFKEEYRRMKAFWSPIGIIADCGAAPAAFRKTEFAPLPTVFLDRQKITTGKGVSCVFSDAEDIGQLAARELLALNYATYAYAPFTDNLIWSQDRERAFSSAVALNHFRCRTFRKGRPPIDDLAYLSELDRWIRELPKPAAIFAANDYIGELVISAADKCGFHVPEDVAVLGVDDDEEICLRTAPTLSSIKPDHEKAGYLAATLLRQLILKPAEAVKPATFGSLAVFHRGSTRSQHRHDDRITRTLETIRERATTRISIPELALEAGVSRRLLELRFRETMGVSIHEEIQSVRLDRAKVLLSQSRAQMHEVAENSGFPSVQAFRKAFVRATGETPLAWRKNRLRKK